MDLFRLRHSLISLTLALLIPFFRCVAPGPDCGQVILVDRETKTDDFHSLWPESGCSTTHRCKFNYRGKDSVVRAMTQLCVGKSFNLNCYKDYTASIVVSSHLDSMKIECGTHYRQQFCAPRGEDLEITYNGNFLCASDMILKISQYLAVYQHQYFSNIYKMNRLFCNLHISKVNATMVSRILPENSEDSHICTAYIILRDRAKKFCIRFIHFVTYGSRTSLAVTSWFHNKTFTESNAHTGEDFCMEMWTGDTKITIDVKPDNSSQSGNYHAIIFEFYTVFPNDDDYDDYDDDDDSDYRLLALLGIPVAAILSYGFYNWVTKDKDKKNVHFIVEGGAIVCREREDSSTGTTRTPASSYEQSSDREHLSSRGMAHASASTDEQNREMGDSLIETTQPSAPPVEMSSSQISSGGESSSHSVPSAPCIEPPSRQIDSRGAPPSYYSLFPDQNN